MKILYDLIAIQPSGGSKFHGGGEYGKVVFEHLVANNKNNEITCIYDKNEFLDDKIIKIINKNEFELINVESEVEIQNLLDQGAFEKFYSALPYRFYNINFNDTQFIYTIHGLRSIEMPTDKYELKYNKDIKSKLKYIYKNLFREKFINLKRTQFEKIINVNAKNRKIIVPSNHTKFSLLNNFPEIKEEEINVLYSPRKKTIQDPLEINLSQFDVEKSNYFLLISGDRWLKNVYRAVQALDDLYCKFPNIQQNVLVLGVKDSNLYKGRLKNQSKFKFFGYVEENVLEQLYKSAFCFIYPTLNEGFGYPPLESMKYGVPVICSLTTSIPEICRDGVVYFNPLSQEELQNRVLNIVSDKELWNSYSQKGYEVSQTVSQKQDRMLDELINYINEPL